MKLSDKVVARLTAAMQQPDLSGTRYRVVRYLARGGMGSVWLAEDTMLTRQVAIKVLDFVAANDGMAGRLLQEAHILAGLEHPGIVPVHDAGTLADGRAFYCMKYVEGQTLAGHMAGMGVAEKIRLLERIAEPLDFAHSRGCVHRDLKPENIMVGAFGEVLVMDWGLAKVRAAGSIGEVECGGTLGWVHAASVARGGSAAGSVVGTDGYMSPEQARGDAAVDHRSDIFSLGAILRFMLTGAVATDSRAGVSNVPRPLRAICDKATAADPGARYQTARELKEDLSRYLDGATVSAYREGWLERGGRLYRRHRTAVVLVGAYLLMRVAFILLARR